MNVPATFLKEAIEKAILSPSGHNTQPWKFRITDDGGIIVMPDFSRSLPVADPQYREMFISVGCVLESISVFSHANGYETLITTDNDRNIVCFKKTDKAEDSVLANAISSRQTNRSLYDGRRLPQSVVEKLQACGATICANGSHEFAKISEYVTMANNILYNNPKHKQELKQWMRYSDDEARLIGDGLSYDTLGAPAIPVFLRKSASALGMNAGMQNRTDKKKLDSSSHLAVFACDDSVSSWIETGRRLMRFLLTAESLGVACAYMNQPCEVRTTAKMLAQETGIDGMPQIILRTGYARRSSRSHRRDINSFLEK